MRKKIGQIYSLTDRKLIKTTLEKRNKRYLNLSEIQQQEKSRLITSRKPFLSSQQNYKRKINTSFLNTTVGLTQRYTDTPKRNKYGTLSLDLSKTKYQSYQSHKTVSPIFKVPKGVSMDKMTSRQYYFKLKNKPCPDQRLFNNFSWTKARPENARNFQKSIGKKLDFAHKHINDLQYHTIQAYQNICYPRKQCKVNLQIQKVQGRVYYRARREDDKPATQLDSDKVKKAYENTLDTQVYSTFYDNSGRQLPSQLQLRQMSPDKDYWHENGQIKRPTLDFTQKMMRQELIASRKQKIKKKKQVFFDRYQLCDPKYFQILGLGRKI